VSGGEAVIHEMITSPSIKERIMKTLPTIAALLTLVVWFGIAIWLGIWPEALLSAFGVQEYHAPIETEIRAFYGGVQFGIATVIFVLWRRGNRFAALLVGGLKLFFFGSGSNVGNRRGWFVVASRMLGDGRVFGHGILFRSNPISCQTTLTIKMPYNESGWDGG